MILRSFFLSVCLMLLFDMNMFSSHSTWWNPTFHVHVHVHAACLFCCMHGCLLFWLDHCVLLIVWSFAIITICFGLFCHQLLQFSVAFHWHCHNVGFVNLRKILWVLCHHFATRMLLESCSALRMGQMLLRFTSLVPWCLQPSVMSAQWRSLCGCWSFVWLFTPCPSLIPLAPTVHHAARCSPPWHFQKLHFHHLHFQQLLGLLWPLLMMGKCICPRGKQAKWFNSPIWAPCLVAVSVLNQFLVVKVLCHLVFECSECKFATTTERFFPDLKGCPVKKVFGFFEWRTTMASTATAKKSAPTKQKSLNAHKCPVDRHVIAPLSFWDDRKVAHGPLARTIVGQTKKICPNNSWTEEEIHHEPFHNIPASLPFGMFALVWWRKSFKKMPLPKNHSSITHHRLRRRMWMTETTKIAVRE